MRSAADQPARTAAAAAAAPAAAPCCRAPAALSFPPARSGRRGDCPATQRPPHIGLQARKSTGHSLADRLPRQPAAVWSNGESELAPPEICQQTTTPARTQLHGAHRPHNGTAPVPPLLCISAEIALQPQQQLTAEHAHDVYTFGSTAKETGREYRYIAAVPRLQKRRMRWGIRRRDADAAFEQGDGA